MSIEYTAVLVRYGEIGIKSRQTRKMMTRLLVRHLKAALKEHGIRNFRFHIEYGRIFIESSRARELAIVAAKVFGVVSTSPVVKVAAELSDILEAGLRLARSNFRPFSSFAVGARRIGEHAFTSQEIREKLGAAILSKLPELHLTVNLDSPQQEIYVEVRNQFAYLFTETISGVGGMPTGSQGKVVCLISNNPESFVAAYRVMKRGTIPIFLHVYNVEKSSTIELEQVKFNLEKIAQFIFGFQIKSYFFPLITSDILQRLPENLQPLLCKRMLLRLAREICQRENADAIVTSEIIGESLSQDITFLKLIDSAVCDVPIYRPCAGDDRSSILKEAMHLGLKFSEFSSTDICNGLSYVFEDRSADEISFFERVLPISDLFFNKVQIITLRKTEPND